MRVMALLFVFMLTAGPAFADEPTAQDMQAASAFVSNLLHRFPIPIVANVFVSGVCLDETHAINGLLISNTFGDSHCGQSPIIPDGKATFILYPGETGRR